MVIAVVVPCYKVKQYVLEVLSKVGSEVSLIYCVDDGCPENSGHYIQQYSSDGRVRVIFHAVNQGVGGAVVTGYKAAIRDGADIVVKLDGDGQMDPAIIPQLVRPIVDGQADYTKGDRFYLMEYLKGMPLMRKMGNAMLSFMNKFSTGYWDIFDPTNGFTAVSASILKDLPLEKISKRYFFESDMLFQLSMIRAVVRDIPMRAVYQGEISSLKISRITGEFLNHHCGNFLKRIFYSYFIRNFTLGSLELLLGLMLLITGTSTGLQHWFSSVNTGVMASAGTVMLSALPIAIGFQLILAFLGEDISMVPKIPLSLSRNAGLVKVRPVVLENELIKSGRDLANTFEQKRIVTGNKAVSAFSERET